jgi:Domain of unknown function DUF1828
VNTHVCNILAEQLSEMFVCKEQGNFVRVRTPFMYPDGGIVDVYVSQRDGSYCVSDLGETLGWLRMNSLAAKRSPKQNRLIGDTCLTLGLELFRGQLIARAQDGPALATAIMRVGQGAIRVADLWFTTRTRNVESVTDEVADFLGERHIAFERSAKHSGRSGRSWVVDFHTRTDARSALVFVLASGSRAMAHRVADHVVAGWHDLQHLKAAPGTQFISLFDDTTDVWSDEDFGLVESLSDICRWSRPDEFAEVLRPAA